jgi:cytidylate kinase
MIAQKYVVNIGRQLGSGGKEIGEKLARELDISFYDKELINLASEESGLCEEFFEKADEKTSQSFVHFPFFNDTTLYSNYLSNDALFKIQSNIIRKLASEKSCLFVGRCADYILRDHPYSMNIFISSYMHDRMKRLCHTLNLSETEVKELIHKTDKCRSEYYNYYTYNTWGAAATYHLCINASVLGIEGTVTFIKEFITNKLRLTTPENPFT